LDKLTVWVHVLLIKGVCRIVGRVTEVHTRLSARFVGEFARIRVAIDVKQQIEYNCVNYEEPKEGVLTCFV
jgi:hypothetical protein